MRRRICGVPLGKFYYVDIALCSIGLVFLIVNQAVVASKDGGYFSTNLHSVYNVYRVGGPFSAFLSLVSQIFLIRGMRTGRKHYFHIHLVIRGIAYFLFLTIFLWLHILTYFEDKISPTYRWIKAITLVIILILNGFHFWGVKVYMREVLGSRKPGQNAEDGEENDLQKCLNKASRKFLKSITLPEKSIKIYLASVLGGGQFGKVVKGEYGNKAVAIKILEKDNCPEFANNVLSELKILSSANSHPNVVKFYGVTFLHSYCGIVLELCKAGSLHSHLIRLDQEVQDQNLKCLDEKELLRIATEIALGMKYLSSKHLVHGDLAARNVLLADDKTAKITDFGLSLRLYYYQLYATSGHLIFPWRWMPPEALADLRFSVQSDIWSFGVILWEMYSLGKIPYSDVNWSSDFAKLLEGGLRLRKPEFSKDHMYGLMRLCWSLEPSRRISFVEIVAHLGQTE